MKRLYQLPKMWQECPVNCAEGWREDHPGKEAAGYHCSACGIATGPACWTTVSRSTAQIAASDLLRAFTSKETWR